MKKILITGAFGYVGGRVSKYLAESAKYQLYLTSRKNRNLPAWANNCHLVTYSLEEKNNILRSLPQIDIIIHLASINEIACAKSPELAVELNTLASFKLIQNAIGASVKRFIYFSTAHVYGEPLKGFFNEDCLTRPTHPYAYAHRAVEDYVATAHDHGQMEGVSVRLSNSIGAPIEKEVDRWMLLVSDLCKQAVVNEQLILKSYGDQKRDFIGLGDVCKGVDHLMSITEQLGNGIFNLGGNASMSIYEMASLISKRASDLLGKKIPIIRPEGKTVSWELEYSAQKLTATGFKLEGCLKKEIDDLLIFCQHHFKKGN
jgi:UDP-glucose 4-epimerase